MKRRVKINGVILVCAVLLAVAFPALFLRSDRFTFFDHIVETFGVVFILFGQTLRVSARGYKSEYSRNGQALIQGGPYTLVRNPMYLGIFLIGLGIVAVLFKLWALCIFLLFFILRYVLLIFQEERKLLFLFPHEYRQYCRKTPRLIPSLAYLAKTEISEYLPLRPSWLKKEIGSILAVLLTVLFIELWEDIRNRGLLAYLNEAIVIFLVIILFIFLVGYLNRRTNSQEENVSIKG